MLEPTCASPFCHGADGYFTLGNVRTAYDSLVGQLATSQKCEPLHLLRVDPGHPETSLLYLKVTDPPCGERMPLMIGGSGQLPDKQLAQMKRWIELGAPYDHIPDAGSGEAGSRDASTDGAVSPRDAAPTDTGAGASAPVDAAPSPADAKSDR